MDEKKEWVDGAVIQPVYDDIDDLAGGVCAAARAHRERAPRGSRPLRLGGLPGEDSPLRGCPPGALRVAAPSAGDSLSTGVSSNWLRSSDLGVSIKK